MVEYFAMVGIVLNLVGLGIGISRKDLQLSLAWSIATFWAASALVSQWTIANLWKALAVTHSFLSAL